MRGFCCFGCVFQVVTNAVRFTNTRTIKNEHLFATGFYIIRPPPVIGLRYCAPVCARILRRPYPNTRPVITAPLKPLYKAVCAPLYLAQVLECYGITTPPLRALGRRIRIKFAGLSRTFYTGISRAICAGISRPSCALNLHCHLPVCHGIPAAVTSYAPLYSGIFFCFVSSFIIFVFHFHLFSFQFPQTRVSKSVRSFYSAFAISPRRPKLPRFYF